MAAPGAQRRAARAAPRPWHGLRALVAVAALAGCQDLGDFRGRWQGARAGDAAVLRVGGSTGASATLAIEEVDRHGLRGRLAVDGLVADAALASLPGAEADVLAGMTFAGAPVRVYVAFVDASDGGGQAFALVALYDDRRVEVRLLRGGAAPLYAIFPLREAR